MRRAIICLSFLLVSSAAWAGRHQRPQRQRPHPHRSSNHVRVTVAPFSFGINLGPWTVDWRPPLREGSVWVSGHHQHGRWIPGYWHPLAPAPRPGVVFAVGHWDDDDYVDGYWRDEYQEGETWEDGFYDDEGVWIEGGWVPVDEAYVDVLYVEDLSEEGEWVDSPEAESDEGMPLAIPAGEELDLHAAPPIN